MSHEENTQEKSRSQRKEPAEQSLAGRGGNRSLRPDSKAFVDFITSGWGALDDSAAVRLPVADFAAERRERLGRMFPGERLVFPAGTLKTRSNDCDYRFRPHSAFSYLSGLGTDQEPDAVLVMHPLTPAGDGEADGPTHEAVLYFRPAAGRDTSEFYADSRYGEFWVGRRPTLHEIAVAIGVRTEHIDNVRDALAKDAGPGGVRIRVVPGADAAVEALVNEVRAEAGLTQASAAAQGMISDDDALAVAASEQRLVKDDFELDQMKQAIASTITGFERVVRELPRAIEASRGERVVEGAFATAAREEGNGLGYETIAASGGNATTLHWIENTGAVRDGDLLLLDAGVEVESLYTADVTRTIPANGTYSPVQRRVWEAVVDAADAAFTAAKPGNKFRDVHAAAMEVIAARLDEWGILPVSARESLDPSGQQHRRWMVHGTSHHLGLDVHDCALARKELYLDGELEPGMIFTIEPGLYFKPDDLLVPEEYRGIGCRCEDDVLITADGNINLTAALPRRSGEIENWMAKLRGTRP